MSVPARALGAAAVVAGAVHAIPAAAAAVPALRTALGVASRTRSGLGVAITFDDGPHPEGTPAVLKALDERGVRATFFLVGEQVARDPSLAREIVAAGHVIALHCDRHRNLQRVGPKGTLADIALAHDRIVAATGAEMQLYRPPYGVFNATALIHAHRRGWTPLLWSAWGRDWEERATAASITELVTKDLGPGSVLLLHDADDYSSVGSWRNTVDALPRVIDAVEAAGLSFADPLG